MNNQELINLISSEVKKTLIQRIEPLERMDEQYKPMLDEPENESIKSN